MTTKCIGCGCELERTPKKRPKLRCPECRRKHLNSQRSARRSRARKLRAPKIVACVDCGAEIEQPRIGAQRLRCPECSKDHIRERDRRRYATIPRVREQKLEASRRKYRRRAEMVAEMEREHHIEHEPADRSTKGKCIDCGAPCAGNRKRCWRCRAAHRQHLARQRAACKTRSSGLTLDDVREWT